MGSIGFGLTAALALILAYDFTTYRSEHLSPDAHLDELALHPQTGGPKNLPILVPLANDEQDAQDAREHAEREHLVVVGGGWGAVALLQSLDPGKYCVTVISPTNYFLFTPLLPSAAVGTVEPRSLVEGMRRILQRLNGHYFQGEAVDLVLPSSSSLSSSASSASSDPSPLFYDSRAGRNKHLLEVAAVAEGNNHNSHPFQTHVYVPYDKLVIACGSVSNSHGIPGLEHCYHLKTIADVQSIRSRIVNNLEIASLPTTSPSERERLLSFVVCGGGPTGVETAAEIFDLVNEDVTRLYPHIVPAQVKVSVIQSREHILNTYSERISQYAEEKFNRSDVNLITNARVKSVSADSVTYTVRPTGRDGGKDQVSELTIPAGFTLWSTGIAMNPFTRRVASLVPNQFHQKALVVDSHLRVKGSPGGSIYAVGDAATNDHCLIDHLYEWIDRHDKDHDGCLTYDEFTAVVSDIRRAGYPLAKKHFAKLDSLFGEYDRNQDGRLSTNELSELLLMLQKNTTSYPATAQTASQQGKYLGKMLNRLAQLRERERERKRDQDQGQGQKKGSIGEQEVPQPNTTSAVAWEDEHYPPFRYTNLGSLAYIGNAAAFDIPFLPERVGQVAGGLLAMYAWRSFYLSEQVDSRTRLLLLVDYIKRGVYGRDLSKI